MNQMKIGNGFRTRLEFVLGQVFEDLECGGDHETRAFVATRLLEAAQSGILKLEDLKGLAQDALAELVHPEALAPIRPDRIEPCSVVFSPIEPDSRSRHV
ncbi:hypothetical protein [Bradyrhizobium sp. RD5-C2]|uniref:hypothetical protein n=1 Tax=Bradyrhizobium sp. RD5-C2 TaxID=244562 RepID=UPI001CC66654|nr:hypothetical protein [Bradyrhizobium sp. RD5-C2]